MTISNYAPLTRAKLRYEAFPRGDERIRQHRVRRRHDRRQAAARRIALVDRASARLVARRRAHHAVRRRRAQRLVSAISSMRSSTLRTPTTPERPGTSATKSPRSRRSSCSANRCRSPCTSSTPARTRPRSATCGSAIPPYRQASPSRSSARGSRRRSRSASGKTLGTRITSTKTACATRGTCSATGARLAPARMTRVGARSLFARVGWQPAHRRRDRGVLSPARQRRLQRRQLRDGAPDRCALQPAVGAVVRRRRAHARSATCLATPTRASAPSSASSRATP